MNFSDLLGLSTVDRQEILDHLGIPSVDPLFDVIPPSVRLSGPLDLPPAFDRSCMYEALFDGTQLPVSTLNLSKRMIDFGIHPPTLVGAGCVYFGDHLSQAMLFDPTESESKAELDFTSATILNIVAEAKLMNEWLNQPPM